MDKEGLKKIVDGIHEGVSARIEQNTVIIEVINPKRKHTLNVNFDSEKVKGMYNVLLTVYPWVILAMNSTYSELQFALKSKIQDKANYNSL